MHFFTFKRHWLIFNTWNCSGTWFFVFFCLPLLILLTFHYRVSVFIFIFIAFCVFLCVLLVPFWSGAFLCSYLHLSLCLDLSFISLFSLLKFISPVTLVFFLTVFLGPSLKFFCVWQLVFYSVSLCLYLSSYFSWPLPLWENVGSFTWYFYLWLSFSPFIDLSSHFCLCFGNDLSVRSSIRISFSGHAIEIFYSVEWWT